MGQTLRERLIFLQQFWRTFETTGSLLPSSRALAREITRPLSQRGAGPIRVLECGPGTGAFTQEVVRHLRPGDVFDIVELNPTFVAVLQRRLTVDSEWQAVAPFTTIHECPLQALPTHAPYDFIVSGIPHINFPTAVVQEIIDSYDRFVKPGGVISYFEYMYIRPLRRVVTWGAERRRVREVDQLMTDHFQRYRSRRASVFANVPPAWVRHLEAQPSPPT
ncbi:MAG: class I SAM-dependent methyltransferase [Planctomycetota bacterium]